MRKSLWIAAILLGGILSPNAYADTVTNYTISFAGQTPLPTSGSFTYNSTTQSFSAFQVVWSGYTFNMAAAINVPGLDYQFGTQPACIGGDTGAQAIFDLLTVCTPGTHLEILWNGIVESNFAQFAFRVQDPLDPLDQTPTVLNSPAVFAPGIFQPYVEGTFTTAAPEPGTGVLLLFGVGLSGWMMAMRKRSFRGLPQAS